ncbi:uncharacterized protein LAESUDRAFT_725739 [Laetiporus sulphureus 93-53]|uniref:Uncharacterized protein n=1 Tax=Laetiporus sulphureus 93-53 TaxID=1314785 RepID=A0A165EBA6_9APHY|nr:uncharacterized protein LAESUDRAFT_725739 [Laetiporus sulphureus 93-53]KZT06651.1 hypothetical protein LAESUDRAFT_725739 [Laetiporus sulphureus 93-53]
MDVDEQELTEAIHERTRLGKRRATQAADDERPTKKTKTKPKPGKSSAKAGTGGQRSRTHQQTSAEAGPSRRSPTPPPRPQPNSSRSETQTLQEPHTTLRRSARIRAAAQSTTLGASKPVVRRRT